MTTSPKKITLLSNFRFQIVLRVGMLTLSICVLLWLCFASKLYATIVILILLSIAQIWSLVYFAEQTNRHVIRFLESVKYGDTINLSTSGRLGTSFRQLTEAFGDVVQDFERIRGEKEEQYLALQTILHHVSIGLLSFDADGKVDFINPAARKLLAIPHIYSLQNLGNSYEPLLSALKKKDDDSTMLVKLVLNDEILQLALGRTRFRQRGRELTLVSLQNIISELEEQEISAWQKLIRVLTHEIMNSIAPITSLAQTVSSLLADDFTSENPEQAERITDIRFAADTIARRSEGLLAFVENFRKLSRIPDPDFATVSLVELFNRLSVLFASECSQKGIIFSISVEPQHLVVFGDNALLEQVFINLVQNAIHAVSAKNLSIKSNSEKQTNDPENKPTISLIASQSPAGRINIDLHDTGTGILPEALDKIFVPFFTTKPDGSGIGLSFARQVLRKQGATMTVSSAFGVGTTFHIRF